MSLESGINSRLSGYSALTALVSTRIYPHFIPQDCALPALAYEVISQTPEHLMSADSSVMQARLQVSVFAEAYSSLKSVVAQVKAALSRYRGTSGSTVFQDIFFDNSQDLYESDTGIFHSPLDFIVWYEV